MRSIGMFIPKKPTVVVDSVRSAHWTGPQGDGDTYRRCRTVVEKHHVVRSLSFA